MKTEATVVVEGTGLEQDVWPGWKGCSSDSIGSDENVVSVTPAKDGDTLEAGKHVETVDGGELQLMPKVEGGGATEERERRPCKLENGAVDNEDEREAVVIAVVDVKGIAMAWAEDSTLALDIADDSA